MNGKVISNIKLNNKYYLMEIENKDFVSDVKPGQFLMIKTQQYDYLYDPLLRRPFGICDVENGRFKILYILVGKGTNLLSQVKQNTYLEFSEPLGNTFKFNKEKYACLVGGGVGIAPLLFLAKEMKNFEIEIDLYYGGKTEDDILLIDEFKKYCKHIVVTTENGKVGKKGIITDTLKGNMEKYDKVYACGPKKMLEATTKLSALENTPIEISLDERMACGMGACLGCLIYIINSEGKIEQKRCCIEGPVFDGSKIIWD
jgi:dihydroorotate dehydrogenase electron transfer subunit